MTRCFGSDPEPFEQAWQRAPLVGHDRTGAAFADLLDLDAVDELVTTRALRHPAFRLVHEGETRPRSAYTTTRRWGATRYEGVIDPVRTIAALADGATLVLQALQTYWAPLGRFCADLHAELGHPTQANAYLTPATERGLGLHYDTHDVVVLQAEGHKRWEVFAPRFEVPLGGQHWSKVGGGTDLDDGDLTPVLETVLAPGDCLYLPRGLVHRVVSEDEPSLHVTVGVHVKTWHDVLEGLLAVAAEDVSVREALPAAVLRGEEPVDIGVLERQLKEALGSSSLDDRVTALGQGAWTQYAGVHEGALAEVLDPGPVDDHLRVALRPGPVRLRDEGERCALVTPDQVVRTPARARRALEAIVGSGGPLRVGDLAPHLDGASRVVLVRRLLRDGVLRRA
ncbi:MAG TPA: cupin domain-containing protein [Acidimicrobiales bacterium]|nr:cupin domain-containing protein [Acidimicrobiales bacterium]